MKGVEFNMSLPNDENLRNTIIEQKNAYINATKANKLDKCYLCNKEISKVKGFCDSHSIPKRFLKNIREDKKLLKNIHDITGSNIIKPVASIEREAGTFQLICKKCDQRFFAKYENYNYEKEVSVEMLAEMELKILLFSVRKGRIELNFSESTYKMIKEKFKDNIIVNYLKKRYEIERENAEINFVRYDKWIKSAIEISKNGNDIYTLIFSKKLDYVVPLAFQAGITGGSIQNEDIKNKDKRKVIPLYLNILPLEDSTVIIMFVRSEYKKVYSSFINAFEKLEIENQLLVINYLMFLYSEEYYISSSVSDELLKVENLIKVVNNLDGINKIFVQNREKFNLKELRKIPNFLDRKNKFR